MITYDENVFPGDVTNDDVYDADIDMEISGSTVTSTQTAAADAGETADNLLTGIGFNLPDGVSIDSGEATMESTADSVNWDATSDGLTTDMSGEWGYDNSPLKSGAFLEQGQFDYTTGISSMESQGDNADGGTFKVAEDFSRFQPPKGIDGPNGGLVSDAVLSDVDGTGQQAVNDTLVFTIELDGISSAELIAYIDDNPIAISWGFPTQGGGGDVPEPSTLMLLGAGAAALGFYRRKRNAVA
jgi:hypothetical protein